MNVPVLQVCSEAYQNLNVFMVGASIPAPQGQFALSKLRQLLNNWNAERAKVWCDVFASFTLTPSLSPHTIGPTGTFVTVIRPVSIDGVSLNLNTNTPATYVPIQLIDGQMYEALSVPGISTSIPTAVYYEEDWPNGKLFFYPVPNFAYPVRFRYRTLLADEITLTDNLDFPPGYQDAVTGTLTEMIADATGRAVPAQTAKLAREARARIEANNVDIPVLDLQDGQQERHQRGLTTFSYHSRSWT